MTVGLEPLTPDDRSAAMRQARERYALDLAAALGCSADSARRIAQQEYAAFVDLDAPGPEHLLWWVMADRQRVGTCWIRSSSHGAWLVDCWIDPSHRRQGHASAAVRLVADDCRSRGAVAISLQVFAHNEAALGCYRALGFTTIRSAMRLDLGA